MEGDLAAVLDPLWLDGLVVLGAAAASALIGWPVTLGVLRWAASQTERKTPPLVDPQAQPPAAGDDMTPGQQMTVPSRPIDTPGLLRGGLWIGLLERVLITAGIAVGQPAVLAVVVAVKGLGRLPELRESRAAGERFIIGTFASAAVAGAFGVVAGALLRLT